MCKVEGGYGISVVEYVRNSLVCAYLPRYYVYYSPTESTPPMNFGGLQQAKQRRNDMGAARVSAMEHIELLSAADSRRSVRGAL
ncbi:hypothetical protein J6590_015704 [Homalodisca vitripennis]|nr:hypothetical protein J6590_015704 [Homalodisca vitripennis]